MRRLILGTLLVLASCGSSAGGAKEVEVRIITMSAGITESVFALGLGDQVVGKDLSRNTLQVAQGDDSPLLYSRCALASQATWIAGEPPATEGEPFRCTAKYRYRQPDQPVTACVVGDTLRLTADAPQRAVTPGQSVVLYQGEVCLGGAIVDQTANEPFTL